MKSKSIIKPEPLKDFKKKKVIYIPSVTLSRPIQSVIKKRAVKEKNFGFASLYLFEDKIILYQAIGAPSAVLSLERLIASGTKEILILGFCGSLSPEFRIAGVASISKAFSEEGTSKHYFPHKKVFYPSLALKKKTEKALETSNLFFLKGSVVSIDAFFRETKPWLRKMQKKGIDLVDMETSAVFALAEFYGIERAALMIISDELFSGNWKKGFFSPELEKRIKDYFLPFL